jgi:hypothetical protein
MRRFLACALTFAALSPLLAPAAEAAVFRCDVDGAVHYQQSPCPTTGTGTRPTVATLNAERQKKLQAERQQAAARPAAVAKPEPGGSSAQAPGFRCDGRQYCSQMSSCEEAKYFLAHCPGVKMDGNHDGQPCEQQWCGH